MTTPYPEQIHSASFFSRERRRQRMRKFLETFEHSPPPPRFEGAAGFPPPKAESREPTLVAAGEPLAR